jgi:hypothetical protein
MKIIARYLGWSQVADIMIQENISLEDIENSLIIHKKNYCDYNFEVVKVEDNYELYKGFCY